MSPREAEEAAGLIFVALMFIGGGIGLLFGRPDVGGAIGMGLGFIAMALIKAWGVKVGASEEVSKKVTIGPLGGALVLGVLGAVFICAGLILLFNIRIPWKMLGGLAALVIGLLFLAKALGLVRFRGGTAG